MWRRDINDYVVALKHALRQNAVAPTRLHQLEIAADMLTDPLDLYEARRVWLCDATPVRPAPAPSQPRQNTGCRRAVAFNRTLLERALLESLRP